MGRLISQRKLGAVIMASALLAGCADIRPSACPAGLKSMVQADLYFGRDIPGGGQVNDEDWQRFVDREIAPRFPEGFTILDASGQWKGSGGIVREPSKRLTVLLSGARDEQERLIGVRDAYQRRFRQDSVLVTEQPVCAGF
jgi:Protein of unknown function (DUF3574)